MLPKSKVDRIGENAENYGVDVLLKPFKELTARIKVDCQSVVQLGGPESGFPQVGLTKVEAFKYILFTESSLVVEIKSAWLILYYHGSNVKSLMR